MNQKLVYYDTGEKLFKDGEFIYINKADESPLNHIHAHDFIEIAYVSSGSGIHIIDDISYKVSKGDLFVINYNIPHEFRSLSEPNQPKLTVFNCIFKPEFIDSNLINSKDFSDITYHFMFKSLFPKESNGADLKLIDTQSDAMEELYEKMYREYNIKEDGYIEMVRAYVIELLVMIFRLYRKKESPTKSAESNRNLIIDKVIRYIQLNYSQDFNLNDLSFMTFLSRNYLCKLFKDCTGMTITEYAQKIRIEEACKLLKETDKKVINICFDVGYNDVKFFNKVFKRVTGKTPREYRKNVMN